MEIRKLTPYDAHDYHDLRLRALKEHPEAFSSSYEDELRLAESEYVERMRLRTTNPIWFMLGAYEGSSLVGVVSFVRESGAKTRHTGHIVGMHVVAEHQGKGIGKALLTEAIKQIRLMQDVEQVNLAVNSDNKSARQLYTSMGFQVYGVERRALYVGGIYYDEKLMVLSLKDR